MADGTTLVLKSGDAQTFADAVAQWGGTGGELTILLPRGDIFSVQNATFVDAPGPNPFTTGTLTIRPTPDVRGPYGQTILDVGKCADSYVRFTTRAAQAFAAQYIQSPI